MLWIRGKLPQNTGSAQKKSFQGGAAEQLLFYDSLSFSPFLKHMPY